MGVSGNVPIREAVRAAGQGMGLFAVSLLLPAFVNVHSMNIMPRILLALDYAEVASLLDACIRLVLMNTLRAVPTYLGALALASALVAVGVGRGRHTLVYFLVPSLTVPLVYLAIQAIYGIKYDFGMPAILSTAGVAAMLRISGTAESRGKAAVVVTQLLFGLQWLDIVPCLTRFGFGRGAISQDIKASAEVLGLGSQSLLNSTGILMSSTTIAAALITAKFMVDHRAHLRLLEADKARSIEMERVRSDAIVARGYREMQALVHDLKTPLTTIQGLASALTVFPSGYPSIATHAEHISEAADRINAMIQDLMSADSRRRTTGANLASRLSAQLPREVTRGAVRVQTGEDLPDVCVNETRITRAVVNLIINALDAGSEHVKVGFEGTGGCSSRALLVIVEDDGPGMAPEVLSRCFQSGFSTTGSSGLGLPFVRRVVEEHGGTCEITSKLGIGTTCRVELPGA